MCSSHKSESTVVEDFCGNVSLNKCMQVPILFNLSDSQLLDLAQQLKAKTVNPGEVVIKEGDEGDSFYIIEEGTFSCYLNDGTKLALIDRGSCFGELALLHNDKRKFNVAAEKSGGAVKP